MVEIIAATVEGLSEMDNVTDVHTGREDSIEGVCDAK